MKENTHSLWAWLNQPEEKKKYLNPLYSHNPLVIWPSVEPQSIQLWQGEPGPALGLFPNLRPEPCSRTPPQLGRVRWLRASCSALPSCCDTTPHLLGLFFRWIRPSQYLDEARAEMQRLVEANEAPAKESTGSRLSRSLSDPAARTENER